ncbi:brassinosteroid-responsive RING protein 1-like [Silene latifolia]|uniref:brassinosteroid-responsive RING protein 1-like n=1 Tax=Silene latifolia TaxID=37657 RepID=UPI003D775189
MGFPAGYTDVLLPNLLINFLSLLGFIRTFTLALLSCLGLSSLVEPEPGLSAHPEPVSTRPAIASASAALIRTMLPAETVCTGPGRAQEEDSCCAVCLCEYEEGEEIRRMRNCRHVFHRSCVDSWIDCDRKTCPLCRKGLVPKELEGYFNHKLWVASEVATIPDLYSDYSHITPFL